jgi:hypothetical protein
LNEHFRRLDHNTLELNVTVDDPKTYIRSFTGKKLFKLSTSPMGEGLCAYSEMQNFQEQVIDLTTQSHTK